MSAAFSTERSPRFTPATDPIPARRTYFSDLIQTIFHTDARSTGKGILFTSVAGGAGVSFICSSIAAELAAQGDRVILADAQTLLQLAKRPVESIFPVCQRIETSTLWVLGPQQFQARATDSHLEESSAGAILNQLAQTFNHIVIDAPSLADSDDAMLLATAVQGTVLIVQSGAAEQQQIADVCSRYSSLGARILGSVYNARTTGEAKEAAL